MLFNPLQSSNFCNIRSRRFLYLASGGFALLFLASCRCIADSASLNASARQATDYLITHCKIAHPTTDFWKNPADTGGLGSDQNGWQGAQALQCLVQDYEATGDDRYLAYIKQYADWILYRYPGKRHLALCQTYGTFDESTCTGAGSMPHHFCIWSDDAGWVINSYVQLYHYTADRRFLRLAYQAFVNCDKTWGVDLLGNSRALHYYTGQDNFTMYMAPTIVAGLSLYLELHRRHMDRKAKQVFAIDSKYYNFVEQYLYSPGPGTNNITDTPFTCAAGLYCDGCHFHSGCRNPPMDAHSFLSSGKFVAAHMLMTAAYILLAQCQNDGVDISGIGPKFTDFQTLAVQSADAFVSPYPDGYLEPGNGVAGNVIVNQNDANVNGFGCYWWVKYVVPLNPQKYGAPIVDTAQAIIYNQDAGDLSSSLWNSPKATTGTDPASHSRYTNSPGWVFVRNCSALSIVCAANWIEKTYSFID